MINSYEQIHFKKQEFSKIIATSNDQQLFLVFSKQHYLFPLLILYHFLESK